MPTKRTSKKTTTATVTTTGAVPTRLECHEGTSNKFWEILVEGHSTSVTYGKIGTSGTKQMKEHSSAVAATTFASKEVAGKIKKGYVHTTSASAAAILETGKKGKRSSKKDDADTVAPTNSKSKRSKGSADADVSHATDSLTIVGKHIALDVPLLQKFLKSYQWFPDNNVLNYKSKDYSKWAWNEDNDDWSHDANMWSIEFKGEQFFFLYFGLCANDPMGCYNVMYDSKKKEIMRIDRDVDISEVKENIEWATQAMKAKYMQRITEMEEFLPWCVPDGDFNFKVDSEEFKANKLMEHQKKTIILNPDGLRTYKLSENWAEATLKGKDPLIDIKEAHKGAKVSVIKLSIGEVLTSDCTQGTGLEMDVVKVTHRKDIVAGYNILYLRHIRNTYPSRVIKTFDAANPSHKSTYAADCVDVLPSNFDFEDVRVQFRPNSFVVEKWILDFNTLESVFTRNFSEMELEDLEDICIKF